jgi:putative tricarboxylic transport membrane protein
MGKLDQISSAFWLLCGAAVVFASFRLGLGTLTHPGPGFLSFGCGLILCGLALLIFLRSMLSRQKEKQGAAAEIWSGLRWTKGVYVVAALIAYTLLLNLGGFLLITTLLLTFLFKAIEPERWAVAFGQAAVASLASFVIFALWLDVQLPRGIVESLLF